MRAPPKRLPCARRSRREEMIDCLRTQWWRERDETLTDIARSYNIKAYGVKEDAALPEDSGTVFVR